MQQCDTLVADALWETIHAEVQDFVQNTLATMLRTTFRKKKDLSRWALLCFAFRIKLYLFSIFVVLLGDSIYDTVNHRPLCDSIGPSIYKY